MSSFSNLCLECGRGMAAVSMGGSPRYQNHNGVCGQCVDENSRVPVGAPQINGFKIDQSDKDS